MTAGVATRTERPAMRRLPLLMMALVSMIVGVLTGLVRIDALASLDLPLEAHGPLMATAFIGTLISLERAVALGRSWAFSAPLLSAAGGLLIVFGATRYSGAALFLLASILLAASTLAAYRRQPMVFSAIMVLAAIAWIGGNALWAVGMDMPVVASFWIVFLVLTIAAERLDLSRLMPPTKMGLSLFMMLAAALMIAPVLMSLWRDAGTLMLAASLAGLALWLARYDAARHLMRQRALPRFVALTLLCSFVWLALGGVLMSLPGALSGAGPLYDATLHAIFIGFVLSMVFAHAPIIVPAILHVSIPYHPAFYTQVLVLNLSLALRISGDVLGIHALARVGALLNVAAIVIFIMMMLASVVRGRYARG